MTNYATKQDVKEIVDKAVGKAVTDLSEVIAGFAQQVDERFNRLEIRADKHDLLLEELKARADKHDEQYNHLLNTLDAFLARIDRYETEQLMRDNQFNRLMQWARKVSKKTGIPLENI